MDHTTTLAPAMQHWLERKIASNKVSSANSVRIYQQHIRFAVAHLGDRPIGSYTVDDLNGYMVHVASSVGKSTAYSRLGVAIDFFAMASAYDWITENPARQIAQERQAPKKGKPRPSPKQATDRLLAEAAPRERLMIMLAVDLGLRRFEIAKLRREDFDVHERQLSILGKGDDDSVLPVSNRLIDAMDEWCTEKGIGPTGWLFPSKRGDLGHLTKGQVGRAITHASNKMGLHITPHRYRHRAATDMMNRHGLKAAQQLMRHASSATTDIYAELDTATLQAMVDDLHAEPLDPAA